MMHDNKPLTRMFIPHQTVSPALNDRTVSGPERHIRVSRYGTFPTTAASRASDSR